MTHPYTTSFSILIVFLVGGQAYGQLENNASVEQILNGQAPWDTKAHHLIEIGEPAINDLVELLKEDDSGIPETARLERKAISRKKASREKVVYQVGQALREISKSELADYTIALIAEKAKSESNSMDYVNALAIMGPKAHPTLSRVAADVAGKESKELGDYALIRNIGHTVGPAVGDAVDCIIPKTYTPDTWNDERYWINALSAEYPYWKKFKHPDWYDLAHTELGSKHIPALLDLVKDDGMLRARWFEGIHRIGMVLSSMGDAAALPLAKLLDEEKAETRWGAATMLMMIGPDMKAAAPALEKTLADEGEAVSVRVAAARAIATLRGTDVSQLYERIPDVQNRLVAEVRERNAFVASDARWLDHINGRDHLVDNIKKGEKLRGFDLFEDKYDLEVALYYLAVGRDLKVQNQFLRDYMREKYSEEQRKSGIHWKRDHDLNTFVFLFGKNSPFHPGRLEEDVEREIKELSYLGLKGPTWEGGKSIFRPKSTEQLKAIVARPKESFTISPANNPIRNDVRSYLALQMLKDDLEFRDRTFTQGDTVQERYDAYVAFFRRGVKALALHGLHTELGSSNYEYKTYDGWFNLYDFVTDPVVKQLTRMYLDLNMIETAQISMTALRGGSKTRHKDRKLTMRYNRTLASMFGEYHGFMLEFPGIKPYVPPVPAILIRRMGPTEPVYEISNRLPGGKKPGVGYELRSEQLNYAYCTPEYVTGCAMFDVASRDVYEKTAYRHGKPYTKRETLLNYGTMGRWSGVIFRNRGGVYLPSYSDEKYNLHHKDVMIAQPFKGARYGGHQKIDFASVMDMVEKDGWIFVHNDEAYAAVRVVLGDYYWRDLGRHELFANEKYSPIIIQTGRKAVYGSFEKFQKAILAAPLKVKGRILDYTGPNSARIEFFMCDDSDDPYPASLPKIDGKVLELDPETNYRSPYMNSKVGSDIVAVSYGDRKWEYDFGKNEVRRVK